MAKSVHEINITNWTDTGFTTPLDRYTFDLEIKWTDNTGTDHTHNSNRTFPNALSAVPLSVMRVFAEKMIIATVRVELGIDSWEDYL